MKTLGKITILLLPLIIIGCSIKMSTEHSIGMNEISKNPKVDLFIHNYSVYKKESTKERDVDLLDYEMIGKIESVYSGKGAFKENMSTILPKETIIYRNKKNSQQVIAKTLKGYVVYKSVPEG